MPVAMSGRAIGVRENGIPPNISYDVRLEIISDGQAADVARAFNEMARSLSRKESLQDDFLTNVSHEFKAPLSYIQGFAAVLQSEDLSEEERKDYLKKIEMGTRRLSAMVSSLLELALASDPDRHADVESYSLAEQLRHVMAAFVPLMEQADIDYDADFDELGIVGNRTLLAEVWANAFSNAVKYTPRGGSIAANLRQVGDNAVVTVADTGIGMSEEQLAHAFDRFYRGNTIAREGAGLGLAIAKTIVDNHGGTIELVSAPNVGTTVTVTLPITR